MEGVPKNCTTSVHDNLFRHTECTHWADTRSIERISCFIICPMLLTHWADKDGYRRRSCTSKTAKIRRLVRFVMYCFITTVPFRNPRKNSCFTLIHIEQIHVIFCYYAIPLLHRRSFLCIPLPLTASLHEWCREKKIFSSHGKIQNRNFGVACSLAWCALRASRSPSQLHIRQRARAHNLS